MVSGKNVADSEAQEEGAKWVGRLGENGGSWDDGGKCHRWYIFGELEGENSTYSTVALVPPISTIDVWRVHSSVKFVDLPLATRATVE